MELTSAPLHKAEVSWRGLLLTVSLLTYWNSPTTAVITIEAVPPHVAEGSNVLLAVHNLPAKYEVINWYRGQSSLTKLIAKYVKNKSLVENGPGYTHREIIHANGSLFISNVRMEDEVLYTLYLEVDSTDHRNITVKFDVQKPVSKPFVEANQEIIDDMISLELSCFTFDSGISLHWFYQDQLLKITKRMKLSSDNSTLKIFPAKRNDSGNYYCEISNQISSTKSEPMKVDVIETVIKPSIEVTYTTNNDLISVFLNCLSNDTEISIRWFFKGRRLRVSNRMKLSKNKNILKINPAKIEDSGEYQCEVSNQISSKKSDPIQLDVMDKPPKPKHRLSLKGIIGIVAQCLMGLIAVIFVLVFLWRRHHGREPQMEKNINQVGNEPTNINETSKADSSVKRQSTKTSKGKM